MKRLSVYFYTPFSDAAFRLDLHPACCSAASVTRQAKSRVIVNEVEYLFLHYFFPYAASGGETKSQWSEHVQQNSSVYCGFLFLFKQKCFSFLFLIFRIKCRPALAEKAIQDGQQCKKKNISRICCMWSIYSRPINLLVWLYDKPAYLSYQTACSRETCYNRHKEKAD